MTHWKYKSPRRIGAGLGAISQVEITFNEERHTDEKDLLVFMGFPQRHPVPEGKTRRCGLPRIVIGYCQLEQTLREHSHSFNDNS